MASEQVLCVRLASVRGSRSGAEGKLGSLALVWKAESFDGFIHVERIHFRLIYV